MAATQRTQPHDDITPQAMARARVPFALALWYHQFGRRLTRFTEWDIERIMTVRATVAVHGAGV